MRNLWWLQGFLAAALVVLLDILWPAGKTATLTLQTDDGPVTIPTAEIKTFHTYGRGTMIHAGRPGEPEQVYLSPEPIGEVRKRLGN